MESRQRSELYYLEQFDDTPVVLYPDGTAGQVEMQQIEISKKIPSRRPNYERRISKTVNRLGQTAVFDSLADYTAQFNDRKDAERAAARDEDEPWILDDMPDDVQERFAAWGQSYSGPSIDEIRQTAPDIHTDDLETATIGCQDCSGSSEYACYTCGYAREFYKYPLVRLEADGETHDVPLDVSRVVALNPQALTLDTETTFHYGTMEARRVLTLHTDRIPPEYINAAEGSVVSVHHSDRMRRNIRLPLEGWSELSDNPSFKLAQHHIDSLKGPANLETAADYIEAMQRHIALKVQLETINSAEYQQKYERLLQKVQKIGKGALALVFEYRYMGMGETDASFSLTPHGYRHNRTEPLADSIDVRSAVDEALKRIA